MKKLLMMLVLVAVLVFTAGCGVWLNGTYSALLDKTTASSAQVAARATAGSMSQAEETTALQQDAKLWQMFDDASHGRANQ